MDISQIKEKLQKPLLGVKAHKAMSPVGRALEVPSDKETYRESAILLTLIPKNGDFLIPLIKRTKSKGSHSGQISFPGGKYEKSDKNFEFTAKREAFEEIGLQISKIRTIGKLSTLYIPLSKFVVYPFVAVYTEINTFKLNRSEVEKLVLIKLSDLQNIKNKKETTKTFWGEEHQIPYFHLENEEIWGATAMMLNEFIEMIK